MQEALLSDNLRHCCCVDACSALLKQEIKLLQPELPHLQRSQRIEQSDP